MVEFDNNFIITTKEKIQRYLSVSEKDADDTAGGLMFEMLNSLVVMKEQNEALHKEKNRFDTERSFYNEVLVNQLVGFYRIRVFEPKDAGAKQLIKKIINPKEAGFITEFVSDKFCELLGITRVEFELNPSLLCNFVHPDDIESFKIEYKKAQKRILPFRWVGRLLLKDHLSWVRFDFVPTKIKNGDSIWTGVLMDISEKKVAEEVLSDYNQQINHVLDGANIGTLEWNVQNGKLKFNKTWAKNLGYSSAEIKIGLFLFGKKGWKSITHPQDIPYAEEMLNRHFSGELPTHSVEVRMRHKKGHWVWIRQEGKVKTWTSDGKPLLMYGVHTDISAQKKAEIELFNLNEQLEERIAERTSEITLLNTSLKESENKLVGITLEVEERERNRFAAELHDGMGPLLSTVKLYFEMLADTSDEEKRKLIAEKGIYSIEMAIQSARELARGLSSQYLNEVGLANAINDFAERINDTKKITIIFQTNSYQRFSDIIELSLYRITTELIKNTLMYANAKKAKVSLDFNLSSKSIVYSYSDNGNGFDDDEVLGESSGFGLMSIRKRVEVLKGTISIQSTPDKGMNVSINVPMQM